MFLNMHQSNKSVLFAYVANVSPEDEIAGLGRTTDHFLENSLEHLGVKGRISISDLAATLPRIHYAFKVLRGAENTTKEIKTLSLNGDEWFWSNGCVMLEMRCDKTFMTLLCKAGPGSLSG